MAIRPIRLFGDPILLTEAEPVTDFDRSLRQLVKDLTETLRQNTVARGFTDRGDPVQIVGSATLARCLQHETDHLDAILFIDRMDPATRKLAMRAIREASWNGLAPPPVRVSPHPLGGSAC